jgi:two-component system, chemotaxis family, CheB/CheR fusion protein
MDKFLPAVFLTVSHFLLARFIRMPDMLAMSSAAKNSPKSKSLATASANGESVTQIAFPIVGVEALAGGLEAFTQLLSHLPENTGMAFVIGQYLVPD